MSGDGHTLRLYTDLNDCDRRGWCWLLRYRGELLQDVVDQLNVSEGMSIIVYDDEESNPVEFDAVLHWAETSWVAILDLSSERPTAPRPPYAP